MSVLVPSVTKNPWSQINFIKQVQCRLLTPGAYRKSSKIASCVLMASHFWPYSLKERLFQEEFSDSESQWINVITPTLDSYNFHNSLSKSIQMA